MSALILFGKRNLPDGSLEKRPPKKESGKEVEGAPKRARAR